MAGLFDLEGHLIFYRSYHFNSTNIAIHLCCIPVILLSTVTFLSYNNVTGFDNPYVNYGSLLAWGYGIYYVLLDWKCGVPAFAVLTTYAYFVKSYYLNIGPESLLTKDELFYYAVIAHVGAWLAQFYGHGVHEKRAPALLDNLLQAIVLAPFFVVFEIAFALGYRLDLKKRMDNEAGKNVRDFKLREKKKAF
ncbi:uncharacterized protein RJT20DRAFT_25913 [Scheffersomyces xylosifermentans]|uniref:uncharacterized protein n=1 Tax=Scheffersomyces xylosifermentans TaxID=1304137 RepID=UPI00315D43FB